MDPQWPPLCDRLRQLRLEIPKSSAHTEPAWHHSMRTYQHLIGVLVVILRVITQIEELEIHILSRCLGPN